MIDATESDVNSVTVHGVTLRAYIAAQVVAALAQRDDKPCRKTSNVIEALEYADKLIRRLG
jgi:hypothetical protein